MEENRHQEQTSEKKDNKKIDLRQYVTIALVVFITFCCCILFFFLIYRYNGFTDFWKQLFFILQPITIGLVLAYILNPVVKFQEHYLLPFFEPRMKSGRKARKLARGISVAGAWIFLVGVIVLLLVAIVPAIMVSITEMINTLPAEINGLVAWIEDFSKGDTKLAEMARQVLETITEVTATFWEESVLPQAQAFITSITSGVIYGVKLILNIFVGIIVSIYVLSSKETFSGQAKKIVYAVFKPSRANVIIDTVRKSNEIFGGFISGKILDSAIIGVIAYIVLTIMKMPDTILVSVIIGVTNVIPFFGPFIGAIPSFLIIVLQDPWQGLYFLIFILILQQIDGNIIGPKILGDSTGLSSFWVVFAIMIFGGMWGFLGMLLGVPLMAVIYYIAQKGVGYLLRKRGLDTETKNYVHLIGVDRKTNQPIYGQEASGSSSEKKKEEKTQEKE